MLVRILVDYVMQPYLFSSGEFELPPFIVIVSALAGEALAGVPGVLLTIPVSATILIFCRRLYGDAAHEDEPSVVQQASLHDANLFSINCGPSSMAMNGDRQRGKQPWQQKARLVQRGNAS